jgi:hypothetical protein
MPNPLLFAWVKNVYSLLRIKGINSELVYTQPVTKALQSHKAVHKSLTLPRFILTFTQPFSTQKLSSLPLLMSHLYPLSTPLITMKTKGI